MEVEQDEVTQSQWVSKRKIQASKLTDASIRDLFRGYYEYLGWSRVDIARFLHISEGTVKYYLQKFNIPMRTRSEALKIAYASGRKQRPKMWGPDNPSWRGGETTSDGYIMVKQPSHPRARMHGYVFKHIIIWEQTHNRLLPPGWVVHHLNGIRSDNRPENLIALPDRKHKRVLAAKAQKIKELESKLARAEREIESLHQAMLAGQLTFNLDGHDDTGGL